MTKPWLAVFLLSGKFWINKISSTIYGCFNLGECYKPEFIFIIVYVTEANNYLPWSSWPKSKSLPLITKYLQNKQTLDSTSKYRSDQWPPLSSGTYPVFMKFKPLAIFSNWKQFTVISFPPGLCCKCHYGDHWWPVCVFWTAHTFIIHL